MYYIYTYTVLDLQCNCACLPYNAADVWLLKVLFVAQFLKPFTCLAQLQFGESDKVFWVRIVRNDVMVRVGGGWDQLEKYSDPLYPYESKITVNVIWQCNESFLHIMDVYEIDFQNRNNIANLNSQATLYLLLKASCRS